jgi:anti-anti-sigma factor
MTTFAVSIDDQQKHIILRITGEIDLHSCPQFNTTLATLITGEHRVIVLDLEKTSYMDSTGLGVIAHSAKKLMEFNGEIRLLSVASQIKKVLELSGLTKKNIVLFDSEEAALNH